MVGVPPANSGARARRLAHFLIALVVYPPLLVIRRGEVVADTKQYLALDPIGMLGASTSLWDPDWALGTVTHQSIGYLWPMGPWFAAFDVAGLPVWFAQRMWLASILFVAGAGLVRLGRVFGWSLSASLVGAAFYALAPYALAYATRMSALIMPWAALPWMLSFAALAVRRAGGPWRERWVDPARVALVATTVGAINASSLIYVGLAVIAWFPYAVWSLRAISVWSAIKTMLRIGVALVAMSLWWAVALVVQGAWGPDVLRFSETLEVVASGSPSTEAWRGLGYWIFYGGDRTGLWVRAAEPYTQNPALVALTFGVAGLGLAALLFVRWQHRAFTLGLAVAGLVLTVGLYPYDNASPIGSLVVSSAAESAAALALRSSPRALPLFLLAVAATLAAGVDALRIVRPRLAPLAVVGLVIVAAAGIPPLWTGRYVGAELARPEQVPDPWVDAGAHLDAGDPNHRALILPGGDFSAHRWGNTIDHVLPGLTDRPVAVRELIPYGSSASADLLIALDRRAQERILEPRQIAPIARLLGAGDVIVASDLEFERYRTPRPDDFWALMTDPATGLEDPVAFGPPTPIESNPAFPMVDEIRLALPVDLDDPPPVADLGVPDALGIFRARPTTSPLVVIGDGESLLEMAGAGLLDPDRVVLYEASLSDTEYADAAAAGATFVLTDGNRQRARRWKTVRDNLGLTESPAGDGLDPDPTDARLDLFPGAPPDAYTVTRQEGVIARASSYGNAISYHTEDRAAHAVDGNPTTAWRTGAFGQPRGEWLELTWPVPESAGRLRLAQPMTLDADRFVTVVAISVNDAPPVEVELDDRSRSVVGQPIDLADVGFDVGEGRVSSVHLTIVDASEGASAVGLGEVWLEGSGAGQEWIITPTSFVDRDVAITDANGVQIVLARERVDPSSAVRDDPETLLRREIVLPVERTFELGGTIRADASGDSAVVETALRILGGQDPATTPRVTASTQMPGTVDGRAGVVIDGDPSTTWRSAFGPSTGATIDVDLGRPASFGELTFVVAADGRHSVPTVIDLTTDRGEQRRLVLDPIESDQPGDSASVTVPIEPLVANALTFTVAEVRERFSIDWYSAEPIVQPIGIAEIEIPGVEPVPPAARADDACRDDLVTIDDEPVAVTIVGSVGSQAMSLVGCEPITLAAGTHRIETADRSIGLAVDRLVLDSPARRTGSADVPLVRVIGRGRSSNHVEIARASGPFWLVMGESFSEGWEASIQGGQSLGPARLVDGFANGWLIDPDDGGVGDTFVVDLHWAPNDTVRWGLWVSAVAAVVCLWLALGTRIPLEPGSLRRPAASAPNEPRFAIGSTVASVGPAALVTMAAATVLAAATTRWWLGLVMAGLLLVSIRRPQSRLVIPAVALGSLGLASAYVVVQQLRYHAPHDGAWPSLWDKAHLLGWVALVALGAEWCLALLEQRRPSNDAPRDAPVDAMVDATVDATDGRPRSG